MSQSLGGVFVQRSAGVTLAVLVIAIPLADGCNPYTPDMLLGSAGGASLPAQRGQSEGGSSSSVTTTSGRGGSTQRSETPWSSTRLTSKPSWGGSSYAIGKRTPIATSGGEHALAGGADTDSLENGGADAGSSEAGGADVAGSDAVGMNAGGSDAGPWSTPGGRVDHSAGAGGSENSGAAGSGGSAMSTCWLDRMGDPNTPNTGCVAEQDKYWYTFLPSGTGGSVGRIEPAPSDEFTREPLTDSADEELRAATGAAYKATMRGQISGIIDQDAGMGFKLSGGAPYSVRGTTLNFYYRADYTSSNRVLRVAIPCSDTEWSPEGTCTSTCGNHYGYELPNTNGKWTVRSVRLDTFANGGNLEQLEGDWGAYEWDADSALAIEFDVRKYAGSFEVSVGPIWLTRPVAEPP